MILGVLKDETYFESIGLAGLDGCTEDCILGCIVLTEYSETHITTFEYPIAFTVFVYLVPETESN